MGFKYKLISAILCICLLFSTHIFAHSGGTNSEGCHNDNVNGGYHCHDSKSSKSFSGVKNIFLAALVIGAISRYLFTEEPNSENDYNLDQTNKPIDQIKFSFSPASTKSDSLKLKMLYAF